MRLADKDCSEDRVRKGAEKLTKHIGAKQQGRLDSFFKVAPKATPDKKEKSAPVGGKKRKVRREKALKRLLMFAGRGTRRRHVQKEAKVVMTSKNYVSV